MREVLLFQSNNGCCGTDQEMGCVLRGITLTDNSGAAGSASWEGARVVAGSIRGEKSPPPISRGRNPPTELLWFWREMDLTLTSRTVTDTITGRR